MIPVIVPPLAAEEPLPPTIFTLSDIGVPTSPRDAPAVASPPHTVTTAPASASASLSE
jgi:hypothetical protein